MIYEFRDGIHIARSIDLGKNNPKFQYVIDENDMVQLTFIVPSEKSGRPTIHIFRIHLDHLRILIESIESDRERLNRMVVKSMEVDDEL